MKIQNIDWFSGQILIDGKGSKQRLVAPGLPVIRLLRGVVGDRVSGPVWLTKDGRPMRRDGARKNFYQLAKRAGVNAHPHQVRVTFANDFILPGNDLGALQTALGHADISTTAHYAGYSSGARALKAMTALRTSERILDLAIDEGDEER